MSMMFIIFAPGDSFDETLQMPLHRCVFCACVTLMSRVLRVYSICIALMFCVAAVLYTLCYFIMIS